MTGGNVAAVQRSAIAQTLFAFSSNLVRRGLVHLAQALLVNSSQCERMLSASATDIALASFMTSDGTQVGKRFCFDWCAPLAVCSFHTLASCSSRNREASLTNAGPETAMHVRDLASNQFTNEDVATLRKSLRQRETSLSLLDGPTSCPGWDHQQSPLRDLEQGPVRLGGRFRDVQQMRALPSGSQPNNH